MVFLHAFLILAVVSVVNGKCYDNNWLQYKIYDHQVLSYPSCFMRGLVYGTETSSGREIVYLKGETSCTLPSRWDIVENVVEYTDWTGQLVKNNWWVECPSGYFLAGFGILDLWENLTTTFSNVVSGRCVRPAGHPLDYGQCYTVERSSCFAVNETCSCGDGYYVTGLHKSHGIQVTSLNKLRCCSMAQGPAEIQAFDDWKTQIMERTLVHLACMAESLGFIHSQGTRGVACGEDFIRAGDSWEASTRSLDKNRKCSELKCDERLKIVYEDWGLKVTDVRYGEAEVEYLQPIVLDSLYTHRRRGSRVLVVSMSDSVQVRMKHTVAKNLYTCRRHSIHFNFDIPFVNGTTLNYRTIVPLSDSDVIQQSLLDSAYDTEIGTSFPIDLEEDTEAVYNITQTNMKTTIPYTAVIAVTFSAQFSGFLSWQQKHTCPEKNYNIMYNNITAPVYYQYGFGHKHFPFYDALKSDMKSVHSLWLWNKMINDGCFERLQLDKLRNRKYYEFEINGTLEIISGLKMESFKIEEPRPIINRN